MNSAMKELENFLISNAVDNSSLLMDIGKFELGTILSETVKKLEPVEYMKSCARMALQQAKNTVFEEELFTLSSAAEKSGIKVIVLKGLFLGRELYPKVETRQSADIDILIDGEFLLPMLNILSQMGYQPFSKDYGFQPWSSVERNIDGLKIMKHEEFAKPAIIGGKKALVFLELHLNLTQASVAKVDTRGLIDRAVARLEDRYTIHLLELNDNLMFLLLHFYEHFAVAFNFYCSGKSCEAFNLQNLHDMALLLDKHGSAICWDAILERADKSHICIYLAFSVYMFNGIYPGRIPQYFLNELIIKGTDTVHSAKKLCSKLIGQLTPKEILYNDFNYIMGKMTPSEEIDKQAFNCPHITEAETSHLNGVFTIDEFSENIDNIYGTYISSGAKPLSSAEGSAKGRLFWDEESLHFHMRVYKNNNVFKGNVSAFSDQDGVELLITDGTSISYRQLIFAPVATEAGYSVSIIDGKTVALIPPDIIKYNVTIHGDGYQLSAAIPWCYLDISPSKGKKLRFNIAVNLCDVHTEKRKTRLTWAGRDDNWWDVDWYGEMTL